MVKILVQIIYFSYIKGNNIKAMTLINRLLILNEKERLLTGRLQSLKQCFIF